MEPRRLLALTLNRLPALRPRERLLLLDRLGSPEELLRLSQADLSWVIGRPLGPGGEGSLWQPACALALAERDARHLTVGEFLCTFYWDSEYPPQLREIYDPPVALYCRGGLPDGRVPLVAVVGTRHPTGAARRAAFGLGFQLASFGAATVSGLARGIDSEAHWGSLQGQGLTVAVLGSAVDEIFPDSSKPLARKLLAAGGSLLSEYPPGVRAASHHFPARNRIISGLSRAVVVVQAPARSGALITADYALDQGRELLVHAAGLEGQAGAGTRRLREEGAPVLSAGAEVGRLLRETAGGSEQVIERPAQLLAAELELDIAWQCVTGRFFNEGNMANNTNGTKNTLIIVESPAKARTIEKYLGPGYSVEASLGHLVDLPKSRLAIDVDNDFEPEYITIRGKAKILNGLHKAAGRAQEVLLASDNDREGEAISFHLMNALLRKRPGLRIRRIVFNEITPQVIREAVQNPREIDTPKVEAQKARRILDRLVGYHLSPILWKKVKNGLSAGRVQSVALRLICERENEVESFVPEEYWSLEAELHKGKQVFRAALAEYEGQKPSLKSSHDCQRIVGALAGEPFAVQEVRVTEKTLRPRPPLTTSKLQQEAANRFGFTSRRTMQVAQGLYEGVDVGSGRVGLITYMRTDSTRISESALADVRQFLKEHYPQELPESAQYYAPAQKAQDAHEAIRPTYAGNTPASLKASLSGEQFKLYSLIWERFVSSQMTPAKAATTVVDIRAGKALFRASFTRQTVKGFQRIFSVLKPKDKQQTLPALEKGEGLECHHFHEEQHFTSGPARYSDATIVKTLEEKGIGRPSTYAPTISVLLDRYYVQRRSRQLVPTQLGRIINNLLSGSFPELVNEGFTAAMEKRLDEIEASREKWIDVLREFYSGFKPHVDHVMETLESIKGILDEPTEYKCETCGRPMVKKLGRFGFFLACTGFPECRFTRPVPLADCPRPGCGGKIVARRRQGGRGKEFYGCTNYPACDFVTYFKPLDQRCPRCGQFLVEKEDKQRGTYKSCINPDCDYLHTQEAEDQSA